MKIDITRNRGKKMIENIETGITEKKTEGQRIVSKERKRNREDKKENEYLDYSK